MWCAVDFVTPLKKRRLARESLSVDGSLRSISEEEDSPSTRTASPPTDASSFVDSFTLADEYHRQVTLLVTSYCCCPRSMQSGVCVTVRFPSVCLSQHEPTAASLQVCCCGPSRQAVLIDCYSSREWRQCRVVSIC